jgi:bifunctional DNase/RNase
MINWVKQQEVAMANIEMVIDSIRVSLTNDQRVVLLKEKEGVRYLPIWIGPAEADAIAVKTQGVPLPRPLTHDFTCTIISALGGSLKSAIIDRLEGDTFYARVVLQADREQKEIDCRPSDALAVAVRGAVPIFVDEEVLKQASIALQEEGSIGQRADKGYLDAFSKAARGILATSEAEARHMHHDYVSTGHLLIALANKKNTASNIMKNAGANLGRIQKDLKDLLKREHSVEGGGVGLTPPVKEAIRISIDEAKKLGSEEVLPEHILLGLVRTSDGVAASQLKNLEITPEIIYMELARLHK